MFEQIMSLNSRPQLLGEDLPEIAWPCVMFGKRGV